jgi:hypothetical protein
VEWQQLNMPVRTCTAHPTITSNNQTTNNVHSTICVNSRNDKRKEKENKKEIAV